jgi:hypothetical protein
MRSTPARICWVARRLVCKRQGLQPPGGDQEPGRSADIVNSHGDVLQAEGIKETVQDLGVGLHAVIVARDIWWQPAAGEAERQAAGLPAQAHDHGAEHKGPLSGARQQQRRTRSSVKVVGPLTGDLGAADLKREG